MLSLYPDQQELMQSLRSAMRQSKAILLQSPTGSGKTAMATDMMMSAITKGKRALFSVPRRDLMNQTSNTFRSNGINHSFVAAGKSFNPFSQTYIGMVDTMARRIEQLPKIDLAVFDETHFGAESLGRVINHYKEQGTYVIGLSATPWKLSGQGLGIWYDSLVPGKSIRWLIDNKRLSDYRYFYGRTKLDLSSIHISAGEYNKHELNDFMEGQRVIIGDCVHDYRTRCMGRLHLVRCTSIKHSQITAEAFRSSGIPARHVDGETPDDEKLSIFKAYARREILVLTFADLLSFGFDLCQATGLDVCVESISDLKPTKSLAGMLQFWGRGLRYKTYPAIFHDHVNNYLEHGLPCSDREWSLASRQKRQSGEKAPATRQCPKCYAVFFPVPICPVCGHTFETKSREIKGIAGELQEMDILTARQVKKKEQGTARTLEELIALGKSRGYKGATKWAAKVLASRMNKAYNKT